MSKAAFASFISGMLVMAVPGILMADYAGPDAPEDFVTAELIPTGVRYFGAKLDRAGDSDFFRFAVGDGQNVTVEVALSDYDGIGAYGASVNMIHLKLFDPMGMERDAEVFTSSTTYTVSQAGAMAGEWRFQVLNGPQVMPMPSYNYLANVSDQYGSGGGGSGGAVSSASILLLTFMGLLHRPWRRRRVAFGA